MSALPGSPLVARIATLLLLVVMGVVWVGWGITQHPTSDASSEERPQHP